MDKARVQISGQFKKVIFDFSGEKLSSDGGVLLLEKVERKSMILRNFSAAIPDYRSPLLVEHSIEKMLRQRVFLLALGYEDCDDSDTLREDPVISRFLENSLASQPTLSRFENSISKRTIWGLCQAFVDQYVSSIKQGQERVIIDIDCTDDPTHGAQQMSLFNGHHGQFMYNELLFIDGETGRIILPVLRPGNVHTSRWMPKILGRIVEAIRKSHPGIEIIIRADAGFSNPEFFNLCFEKCLEYCLGLKSNEILNAVIKSEYEEIKKEYGDKKIPYKYFTAPFKYQAKSWNTPLLVCAKIESTELGMNTRFFISSMGNYEPQNLYFDFYAQRGEACENRIKDIKNYCFSDRLSCETFWANFFRLMLSCLSYELLRETKVLIKKTVHEKSHTWGLQSIRLYLLKIGCSVKEKVKYIKIKLSSAFVYKDLFKDVILQC